LQTDAVSRADAAKMLNVSPRSVLSAVTVLGEGRRTAAPSRRAQPAAWRQGWEFRVDKPIDTGSDHDDEIAACRRWVESSLTRDELLQDMADAGLVRLLPAPPPEPAAPAGVGGPKSGQGEERQGDPATERVQGHGSGAAAGLAAGIVFSEPTDRDGAVVFQRACKFGLEAIVSKRLMAACRSAPSRDWLKVINPNSPAMVRARAGRF
jgi:hypothetical protein